VEIRALTDPDRGLILRAKAPPAVHKALHVELERLPVAIEVADA
jgi:hypothetical protein